MEKTSMTAEVVSTILADAVGGDDQVVDGVEDIGVEGSSAWQYIAEEDIAEEDIGVEDVAVRASASRSGGVAVLCRPTMPAVR